MSILFDFLASVFPSEEQSLIETANEKLPTWTVIKAGSPMANGQQHVFCFNSEPVFYDTETDMQVVGWDNYETAMVNDRSALIGRIKGVNPRTWEIRR